MTDFELSWDTVAPLFAALGDDRALAPHAGTGPADATVLAIATGDVAQPPKLPEGGGLSEAPLGEYDAVELTVWGRPAAKGLIAFGDGVAAVGGFEFAADDADGRLGAAVVSALAEEAFLEGAEWLVTLVSGDPAEVPAYLAEGWREAAKVSAS
ncbi:hypothetical protein [Sinomonas atrocyanea]|uniref:hypothetical protein n=1 Tax=Sinomonas atrocyanea TaxID=37927 RepID=UPI00277FFCF8|nr:hypothetical protein [Sinomonas atrocyanea]MDQ0259953.1 hypothetical protein [Sinomonas atrocyanea]MDR6619974.1 hypothetical protein [Sinomonas atrocyanea]